MKKILLVALAATMIFPSCMKENDVQKNDGNVLVVKLPDNVALKTRAVEDQVATNSETEISNITVFLLNGNSVVATDKFDDAEIQGGAKRIEQVPAAVNRVILVANVPAANQADVEALTSASAIHSYPFTIASQNDGNDIKNQTFIGDQASFTSPGDPLNHTDHDYKEAAVTLNALTARFEIGAVKEGTGIKSVDLVGVWINAYYADGSIKDDEVVTNPFTSNYWVTDPVTNPASNAAFDAVSITNAYDPTQYFDGASDEVTVAAGSKVYGYQVFAGDNIPHVILLVKGEYADGHYADGNKYFLGYVTFNKYHDGVSDIKSIDSNVIYKMGVGATGIAIDADMITDKPEKEKFDLAIKVTITKWTEKNVTPGV